MPPISKPSFGDRQANSIHKVCDYDLQRLLNSIGIANGAVLIGQEQHGVPIKGQILDLIILRAFVSSNGWALAF